MTTADNHPTPVVDGLTQPFWDGASAGRLVLQRCQSCGHFDHPPFPECTRCRSLAIGFEPVSGSGVIFERSIVEAPIVPGFEGDVPYVCLVVELVEQSELLVAGNLVESSPYEAVIGRSVQAVFRKDPNGFTVPVFRLTSQAT